MAIETNFLTYRRPDGRMGDVDPKQNNFAGIGTTGGGVPGDSFPDVKTGVLAQIQHLVVYSGETIAAPVAPRTQLKQEHILLKSRELNRPVRFSDLARRWAADPKYGQSIEWAAESFRAEHCRGKTEPTAREALPWTSKTSAPLAESQPEPWLQPRTQCHRQESRPAPPRPYERFGAATRSRRAAESCRFSREVAVTSSRHEETSGELQRRPRASSPLHLSLRQHPDQPLRPYPHLLLRQSRQIQCCQSRPPQRSPLPRLRLPNRPLQSTSPPRTSRCCHRRRC